MLIDVVSDHLARRAISCRGSARTFPRRRTRGARASRSPTPTPTRCAATSSDARRAGSRFRADGLRLDAVQALVDTTAIVFLRSSPPRRAAEPSWSGRCPIAESDLNDEKLITGAISTVRSCGAVGRSYRPCDPHRASCERQGDYADLCFAETGEDVAARLLSRRHVFVVPRRRHGRRWTAVDPGHGCSRRPVPTTRSASCPRGPSVQNLSFGESAIKAALVLFSPRPQCFSWARSGRIDAFQFFSSHPEPELAAPPPRAAKPSSPSTAGMLMTFPTRRIRTRFAVELDWAEVGVGSHARLAPSIAT